MNLRPHIKPFIISSLRDIWPDSPGQRCLVILTAVFCIFTIFAAYAGYIAPAHTFWGTLAPLAVMAFPSLLYLLFVFLIICIIFWMRGARMLLITLIAVIPSAIKIVPLHVTPYIAERDKGEKTFSLLTYNVMSFLDFEGPFKEGVPNRTVQYILDSNPDIVCLQETLRAAYVNTLNITLSQRNLRDLRYPYQMHWHDGGIAMYSRYPLKEIYIGDRPDMPYPHYKAARVYLYGDSITIINCHLQSIGLDVADRNIYHEVTDGDIDFKTIDTAGSKILDKLTDAFIMRAKQAEFIRSVLDSIPGNVIVCGDFNDVPLSFASRRVQGDDMHDAFAATSLGPRITFHDNRFYFRIDHVFYRGNIGAYRSTSPNIPSSDHYPLLVRFKITPDK